MTRQKSMATIHRISRQIVYTSKSIPKACYTISLPWFGPGTRLIDRF